MVATLFILGTKYSGYQIHKLLHLDIFCRNYYLTNFSCRFYSGLEILTSLRFLEEPGQLQVSEILAQELLLLMVGEILAQALLFLIIGEILAQAHLLLIIGFNSISPFLFTSVFLTGSC